jgi:hypothetical protein
MESEQTRQPIGAGDASFADQKKLIESQMREINEGLQILAQKIELDTSRGVRNEKDTNMALTLGEELKRLDDSYVEIDQKEADVELQKVGESSQRLRESKYSTPQVVGVAGVSIPQPPPPRTKQEVEEQRREDLSVVLGIPKERINPDLNAVSKRTQLALGLLKDQPTEQEFLEKQYGAGNVRPINIAGKNEFIIKKPDGKFATTDIGGGTKILGSAITEVPTNVAETAAGLSTFYATGGQPAPALLASGATYFSVGTAIDAAAESALGLDPNWERIVSRRGTEAVVGTALGFGIDKTAARFLGNKIGPNFVNEFANNLEASASRLQSRAAAQGLTGEVSIPAAARIGGEILLEEQKRLASVVPSAGFAGSMKRTQQTLRELWNSFSSKVPANPSLFQGLADQNRQIRNGVVEEIAKRSRYPQSVATQAIRNMQGRNIAVQDNQDELGQFLLDALSESEQRAVKIKNETFGDFFDFANQSGFTINPEDLLSTVEGIVRKNNPKGAYDSSATNSVLSRLTARADAENLLNQKLAIQQKLISENKGVPRQLKKEIKDLESAIGPIDAHEFDSWIKAFRDARPDNAAGASTKDQLSGMIAGDMSALRRSSFGQYEATLPDGTQRNLGDLYDETVKTYDQRMSFERNLLGSILREDLGEMSTSPRQAVSATMREPYTIKKVLDAVSFLEREDPTKSGLTKKVTEMMQSQYFSSLGYGMPGVSVSSIKYDPAIMDALFGQSSKRITQSLDALNKQIVAKKLPANATFQDVIDLGNALDTNTRNRVLKNIYLRLEAEKELQSVEARTIFRLAKKTNFQRVDSDSLNRAILSDASTVTDVKELMLDMSRMSATDRNAYKGDFIRGILEAFPGGKAPQGKPFVPIFDTEKFVTSMTSPSGKSPLRTKIETVLGKDDAQFLYDLANAYNANIITNVPIRDNWRTTMGAGGVSVYLAQGVTSSIRNRLMAAMLSSPIAKRPGMAEKFAAVISNTGRDEAWADAFKAAFTTRIGLTALSRQMQDDPEFATYVTETARQFAEDDKILSETLGEEE